jgi:hypothetical protein
MDRTALTQSCLLVYSGILTLVLAVVVLSGSTSPKRTSFDVIDVKRINVVEPDGTVRLVISDKAHFPGLLVRGRVFPYDRNTAGMIFYDDEGTENGGLIFGGMKDSHGQIHSYGHLSFDKYMGDQLISLESGEQKQQTYAGINFIDEPEIPISVITDALQAAAKLPPDQRNTKIHEALSGEPKAEKRAYLGRNVDGSASLELKDPKGRDRVVVRVTADGTPSLQFLDEHGRVTAQYPKEAQ